MESEQTKPRIRIGMDFLHQGKMLTAVYPFYGPEYSRTLKNLIKKDGYREPTSTQLTSFVDEYFNGEETQAKEVNRIMEYKYFIGFTGILYVPEKGALGEGFAHFINYPEFNKDGVINKNNLLKRLGESYTQVPFKDLKEGCVDWKKMAKHPYFVAWAGGKEGAEKLAELASKHSRKEGFISIPDFSNLREPIARVTGLNTYWNGGMLGVWSSDDGREGSYAFGVLKTQ